MTIRKHRLILLSILLFVLIIALFFLARNRSEKAFFQQNTKKDKVRLAVANALITAPVLIALENNFFDEVGLDVTVTGKFSSGRESLEHMLSGKADLSTPATTPVVLNSFKRKDFSIFVTFTNTYEGVKIVARNDHGIAQSTDLKGKIIGVVPGTISEILENTLLVYNKILLSEVSTKEYMASQLPEALAKGEVDAISIWEPYAYEALKEMPHTAVKISSSQVYRIAVNMAVMNEYAEQNPVVLEKFIKGLQKSIQFMKSNTSRAQELMANKLGMEKSLVENFWNDNHFELTLDQLLILTMENEASWAIKHFNLDVQQLPNYLEYIIYQSLETVSPKSVTLIRPMK